MTEGRFQNPLDCGGFIDCLPDRKGGLMARHGSCRGRGFHPVIKKCVELKKVNHICLLQYFADENINK